MNVACAIYTRTSSEEGLEQNFNSLDAQREACEAYVVSQKSQGWKATRAIYDDGGYSGGNVQRPALKRLLEDVAQHRIKIIVVYKVDRLTRSLADFAKLVELFDAHGVSFVSVTQQFNTTTSMGRLTLNVLLSFAQFEREVTGERIRDKIAASKRKGLWMGGIPPMGYRPHERSLLVDEEQAERVREIFALYLELGSVSRLKAELDRRQWMTPARISQKGRAGGGGSFSRGHLHRMLKSPIYIGRVPHRGLSFPAEHPAIVDAAEWEAVQARLADNLQGSRSRSNATEPSMLAGVVFDAEGNRFTVSHSSKNGRRYRYYISSSKQPMRLPARELEMAIIHGTLRILRDESKWLQALEGREASQIGEVLRRSMDRAVRIEAGSAGRVAQMLELLERVTVHSDRLEIAIRAEVLLPNQPAITSALPAQLKRCGMAMRLLIDAPGRRSRREPEQKLMS
jgi:site-specific DNA recombinase